MAQITPTHAPSAAALRRNVQLFYAYRFFRETQLWIPIWVIFLLVERGFSLGQVGTAEAGFLLAIVFLEVPTGAVADRYGRRISLALAGIAMVLATVIFGFTESFGVLVASFLVWAFAETLASGADLALLYDSLKALGREEEYEKHAGRGEAALWGGALLGVLLGGPIAAAVDTQFTIFMGAVATGVSLLLILVMAEPPRHDPQSETISYLRNAREAIRIGWSRPALRSLIVFAAAIEAGMNFTHYLLQPFLLEQGREVGFSFSALQAPGLAAGALGALMTYRLVRWSGEVRLLVALPLLCVGLYAALALIDHLGAVTFFVFIFLLQSAARPVATGYINRRAPSAQRATILSLQSLMVGLLTAPLVVSVGFIFDEAGIGWAFAFAAITLAALTLPAGALWLRAHGRDREPLERHPPAVPPSPVRPGEPR